MTDAQALVERAASLAAGDDAEAMLAELSDESTFRLRAAFAYAKRRERDPAVAGAADLLELALAASSGQLQVRWWHRLHVLIGGLVVLQLAQLTLRLAVGEAWEVVAVGVLIVSVVGVVVWVLVSGVGRRRLPEVPRSPASSGRLIEVGDQVLRAGRAAVAEGSATDEDRLADHLLATARAGLDGPLAEPMARGALVQAERSLLMLGPPPRLRPVRAALVRARERAAGPP